MKKRDVKYTRQQQVDKKKVVFQIFFIILIEIELLNYKNQLSKFINICKKFIYFLCQHDCQKQIINFLLGLFFFDV